MFNVVNKLSKQVRLLYCDIATDQQIKTRPNCIIVFNQIQKKYR